MRTQVPFNRNQHPGDEVSLTRGQKARIIKYLPGPNAWEVEVIEPEPEPELQDDVQEETPDPVEDPVEEEEEVEEVNPFQKSKGKKSRRSK